MDGALGLAAGRLLASLCPDAVAPGLTPAELAAIEHRYGFFFADDHRAFLAAGLPVGPRWPDWRGGVGLVDQLGWPVEGVLYDVVHNAFWYEGWGPRPVDAVAVAAGRLAGVPRMVPVYSHRYLPAGPGPGGHPVLSIVQTDIIVYGHDLLDYIRREFAPTPPSPTTPPPTHAIAPFWRDLLGDLGTSR